MKTYITTLVNGNYVTYPDEIDNEYWEGQIGTTLEDFYNGKWVLLTNEQVAFHEEHPTALISEVFNMQLNNTPSQHVRTLNEAKQEMIETIDEYDHSNNVNGFIINGETSWFTPDERANYKNSVDSAKLLNVENVSFYVNDNLITVSTTQAEVLLAQLQLYADQCFIITRQHKAAVEALNDIEDVDNYDYTTNYPNKINLIL